MSISAPDNLSGRLNKRITLQQPLSTSDGGGGFSIAWQDVATLWADIAPHRSSEPLLHDKLMLHNLHRITIRYRSDITANMRFIFGSRIFLIIGITNVDERKHTHEISTREEI